MDVHNTVSHYPNVEILELINTHLKGIASKWNVKES